MRSDRFLSAFLFAVVCFVSGGCGGGLDKVVVDGDVSYQGEPVVNGEILFYPSGATQGPVSGASIKDGHYEAVGKGGVPVGTHRVEIRGFRAAGLSKSQAAAATHAEMEGGIREQYLPKKFNEETTLEATVPGETSRTTINFTLTE